MAKRHFQLTDKEIGELWQAYERAKDTREQQRWQAVRLYGEGWQVGDIKAITGCSEASLLRWARLYRKQGVAGLKSPEYGGNRGRLTKQQRAEVKLKLHQYHPQQVVAAHERRSDSPYWTVEDVKIAVARWYGVEWASRTSYRTLLHECGLSVQRLSKQYRSRPSAQAIADAEAELEKK